LYVGIARAGSSSPVVAAGSASQLKTIDFGPPLHILVIPSTLHAIEEEYLKKLQDMLLSEYFSAFVETFEHVTLCNPPGTAYFLLGTEILEMVRSYLHDSEYFLHHDDIVNHYASLVYAHGWFIAGSYLGLYQISASNFTWENILFPGNTLTN
jgi:hypothetical protein